MKYIAYIVQLLIIIIGLYMMVTFPDVSKPPFIRGLAIFLIGVHFAVLPLVSTTVYKD